MAEAQYYVSTAGSDDNTGTFQLPFKTIQKAANSMLAGDTCYIMAGEYRETVVPVNNGTPENPIVFKNYGDQRVVILGSDSVSGWTAHQNGIYKAYIPSMVSQLFANRQRAFPARYPDFLGGDMCSTSDWNPVTASADGDAVFQGMNKPEGYWEGGYCQILTGHKWVAHIGKISTSNGNAIHCDERSSPWNNINPEVYLGPGKGYICNHLNALDKANEWHWQNDTLYYFPASNTNIDTTKIEARTRLYGFDCEGKSHIEIYNIHFIWSSVNFGSANTCKLDGGSVLFPSPFFNYDYSWIRVDRRGENYSIDHWDGKGVHISGSNNIIKNCYISHSWGDGVSVGGKSNKVENCLIEDCDWSATDAGAISATGSGHCIIGNTLRKTARSILIHRNCDSMKIMYNDMYNCGLMCVDLGLTYSYYTNGRGTEIAYNWVHDNHAAGTASGIYLDNHDTAYVVHHNVIWNCDHAIQTNTPAINHEIYNNTAWFCKNAQRAWPEDAINQQVINNLSDKPWSEGTFLQTNLTTSTPKFVNPEEGDFRLQENSPAIDYGTHIPGITDDFVGTAPDAGAYEFGGDDWEAGSSVELTDLSDLVIIPEPESKYLIAYYPFNGNAQDESGNGFHASEIIGATLTDDMDGNPNSAFVFDGIDDKIIIPHIGLNPVQDFSISFWFQPNDLSKKQWLFGNRNTSYEGETNGLEINISEGDLNFLWPDEKALSKEFSVKEWQFVVYTKENTKYLLYYNGKSANWLGNTYPPTNIDPWRIGAYYDQQVWDEHFMGKMDEIRIYNKALSSGEIEELFAEGNPIDTRYPDKSDDEILIYPNPGSSKFYFSGMNKKVFRIKAYDSSGRKVLDNILPEEIDLTMTPDGLYLVVFLNENNQEIATKRIIKDRKR